jgi:hypothetical protein
MFVPHRQQILIITALRTRFHPVRTLRFKNSFQSLPNNSGITFAREGSRDGRNQ